MTVEETKNRFCPRCGQEATFEFLGTDNSENPPFEMSTFQCDSCQEGGFINKFLLKQLDEMGKEQECGNPAMKQSYEN